MRHRRPTRPFVSASSALVIAVAALAAPAAGRALTQPNGMTIPTPPGCDGGRPTGLAATFACVCDVAGACNIGDPCPSETSCPDGRNATCESTMWHVFNDNTCIPTNLDGLDPVAEASTTPETFSPTCPLTFTVVTRGTALFQDAFGWYNVTGERPDPSDLHVMLDCRAARGDRAVLDIQSHPDYRGGAVGFFLVTPESLSTPARCAAGDCCATVARAAAGDGQIFYSESRFNPDFAGSASFIHLLIYDSHTTSRKFYFAWEDIYGGSNGDFTDVVTSVEGVECEGGGSACDTGMPGVCAFGANECRDGVLSCHQLFTAEPDRCDGVDNDCDGDIDEGATCERANEVCQDGRCVPNCRLSDEFVCASGFECDGDSGFCIETACRDVTCGEGTVCRAGACVGSCDGLVCPAGQTCRLGNCVDPCAGVTCSGSLVCSEGVCVPGCGQCGGLACTGGLACDETSGRCVDPSCPASCPSGTTCRAGDCVDACDGAICPPGQLCEAGQCRLPRRGEDVPPAPPPPGSPDGGGPLDGGRPGTDGGPTMLMPREGSAACACRVAGGPSRSSPGAFLVALALGALTVVRATRRRRDRLGRSPG